jgi:hypothetical protein
MKGVVEILFVTPNGSHSGARDARIVFLTGPVLNRTWRLRVAKNRRRANPEAGRKE